MKQILEIMKIDGIEYKIGINQFYHENIHTQDKFAYELPDQGIFTHPTFDGCIKMIRMHHMEKKHEN